MTRRDLQLDARGKGRPWDLGKAFEQSAAITPILRKDAFGAIAGQAIELAVNGQVRQSARLSDLVWSVPELISHLSRYYHLTAGDLIYTGTPAGVGPVVAGDVLAGRIDGLPPLALTIAK
jgi:fumarylpyruvate hydrolase